jgi:potassium-dependent mechanosensitive channel
MIVRARFCFAWAVMFVAGVTSASAQQPVPPVSPPAQVPAGQATPPAQPPVQAQAQPAQAPAPAAPPPLPSTSFDIPAELLDPVARLGKSIENAERAIQNLKELEEELSRLRGDVEGILSDSTTTAEGLRPKLTEIKGLVEKLGPPPKAGEPAEAPAIAAERQRLNQLVAQIDGAVKTTELTWVRARQLIERITVMRHAIFTRNLFERRTTPLLPGLWRDVGTRTPGVIQRLAYNASDWWVWGGRKATELGLLGIGALALWGGLTFVARKLTARRREKPIAGPPSFFERAISIAWTAPLRMLPAIATLLLVYSVMDEFDLFYNPWDRPAAAILHSALIYIASSHLFKTALAPSEPHWRIVPLSTRSARHTVRIVKFLVAVYVLDLALIQIGRAFFFPLTLTVAQSFIANMLAAGALAALVLSPFETQNGTPDTFEWQSVMTPRWFKWPLALVALTIALSSCFGYLALGRFISQQVVLTGLVVAVVGLMYLAIRAMTRERTDGRHHVGDMLEKRFGLDDRRRGQLAWLAEAGMTFLLLLAALPVLLLQWGFAGADIRDWMKAALFGFEVGQFRISLARILIGIIIFTVLLFVTRLLQKWLREQVLAQPRMDSGIANSIDTAVGYGGIALAALVSVSYAGFDITSLAIVAGALSVGIGFGLQSIVNNFVSGLILLVERPIKVGDWVVVGDQQGNVRRISVRSTEIETFDRASLIVPNSELISGRVLNWTHRNLLGRVIIKVSVDANADPQKMLTILKAAAAEQALVLKQPEPSATLDYFGSDKLDFSLRATLSDVNHGGKVQSDLRLAILKGCRQAGLIASMTTPQPAIEPLTQQEAATVTLPAAQPAHAGTAAQAHGNGNGTNPTIPPPPPISIPVKVTT